MNDKEHEDALFTTSRPLARTRPLAREDEWTRSGNESQPMLVFWRMKKDGRH